MQNHHFQLNPMHCQLRLVSLVSMGTCFSGDDFKNWVIKLEQFFEAEQVLETSKVRTEMSSLDGKALQWHHYFVKSQGGMENLS